MGLAGALTFSSWLEGKLMSVATGRPQIALFGLLACAGQVVLWKGCRLHPDVQDQWSRGDLVTLAISDFSRIRNAEESALKQQRRWQMKAIPVAALVPTMPMALLLSLTWQSMVSCRPQRTPGR